LIGQDDGVAEAETPVWYADSDDPYYTLKHSGGPFVACAAIPMILVFCAGSRHGASLAAVLLVGLLVPLAAIAGIWEFLLDRRSIVEMRLTDGKLTAIRANRTSTSYPLSSISRIEVLQRVRGGEPSSSRMRLHIGERVEKTRSGPADLPSRWAEAVTIAEIETTVHEKVESD
jgi:hypothetical protein